MKNSEVHCPISGSSALRIDIDDASNVDTAARIIDFPGAPQVESPSASTCGNYGFPRHAPRRATEAVRRGATTLMDTELARSLRYGTARGVAFNRVKRWQAVAACVTFSALAFATLLLGM